MNPAAAKEKRGSSARSRSYLQTRVRVSRLYEAAFILAFIELSRRLHQAYAQAYDKQAAEWLLPQNPTIPLDVNKIGELLNNPTCSDFVTNLINKAAELNPNNPANSSNALDLINAVKNGKGGYFLQSFSFDGKPAGGTVGGSIANGDAKVYISPQSWGPAPTATQIRMSQEDYALAGLHETVHHAGRFLYSDQQLAIAAHAITGIADHYPAANETNPFAWSRYWNDILVDHCKPPRWSNSWNH